MHLRAAVFPILFTLSCSAAPKPGPGTTDGDADADSDSDSSGSSDDLPPDCVAAPESEGCPCDSTEPVVCFTGAPGRVGEGHCSPGIRSCTDFAWGPCQGETLPSEERCNAFDDDCDGEADEDVCGDGTVETHPCGGEPVADAFTLPELELHWGTEAPDDYPLYVQSVATPVVGDLVEELDGPIPEIVLVTYNVHLEAGVVRVFSGRDHALLWTDAGFGHPGDPDVPRIDHDSHPAIGDLTGDGRPELLVARHGGGLLAYLADGDLLWESDSPSALELGDNGSIAIADLENDGDPEIVVGRTVLDSDGNLLWVGSAGSGSNNQGPISCIADLDDDGVQEVIAGRTAYRSNGEIYWDLGTGDGFCAIADLYDERGDVPVPGRDGQPEVVRVWLDDVIIHAGRTGTELARWDVPPDDDEGGGGVGGGGGIIIIIGGGGGGGGGGLAGPPTVADFDGDGLAEIGVAGATTYAVWDVDAGEELWHAVTEDDSSKVTASTVFDFNGDGTSEVIYNDEKYFRVYDGPDGDVLFEEPNPSRTRTEEPVVADVDADGNAEIVFVANAEVDFAGEGLAPEERVPGFEIWGSGDDAWIPARRIWNQHTYHVDNVDELGEIPMVESPSWMTHNTYRAQQPSDLVVTAPDLTAEVSYFDESRCAKEILRVCAAVQNTGENFVGPGLLVTFYEGNPEVDGIAIGSTETETTLDPGEAEVVCVDWHDAPSEPTQVWVDVDASESERECDELNNVVYLDDGMCMILG